MAKKTKTPTVQPYWFKDYSQAERDAMDKSDFAGPGTSFPIKKQEDVTHAAMLLHHAKNPSKVKKRIAAIARRRGFKLPETWGDDRSKTAQEPDATSVHSNAPLGDVSVGYQKPRRGRMLGHLMRSVRDHIAEHGYCDGEDFERHVRGAMAKAGGMATAEKRRANINADSGTGASAGTANIDTDRGKGAGAGHANIDAHTGRGAASGRATIDHDNGHRAAPGKANIDTDSGTGVGRGRVNIGDDHGRRAAEPMQRPDGWKACKACKKGDTEDCTCPGCKASKACWCCHDKHMAHTEGHPHLYGEQGEAFRLFIPYPALSRCFQETRQRS